MCIDISIQLLVIIQIVDQLNVGADKVECHPPVTRDANGPETVQVASQGMEPITGSVHIGRRLCDCE